MMQQPIEGMTRTNRRTGEVQALRGGAWVTVQPGSAAPSAPGIVQVAPAQPRPETPPSGFRPTPDGGLTPIPGGPEDPNRPPPPAGPPSGFRFRPDGSLEPIPGGPEDPGIAQANEARRQQVEPILGSIFDARQRIGGWTTGLPGQVLDQVGGTQANDLRTSLDTIKANLGFDRLQAMRDASQTGGALGNVTELELRMLQSALASLDQSQSQGALERNLGRVELHYLNFLNALDGRQRTDNLDQARALYRGEEYRPPVPGQAGEPEGLQVHAGETDEEADARIAAEMERRGFILLGRDPDGSERWGPPPNRGGDQTQNLIENSIGASNPITGGLTRAVSGTFGQESGNAFTRGVQDVVTLGLNDELRAGIGAVTGQGSFDANLSRERAVDRFDENNNFGARLGGQISGGLALPVTRAPGLGRAALESGIYGGAYGAGSGQGSERVPNALVGAVIGAGLPLAIAGGGRVVQSVRGRGAAPQAGDMPETVANALVAEGIPGARPIADPSRRGRMAVLETTPGGNPEVRNSLEQTRAGIEGRVGELTGPGTSHGSGGMGETVRTGLGRRVSALHDRAKGFYDRAAEAAADVAIDPKDALDTINRDIARLERNPRTNQGVLSYLRSVRDDLSRPGRTVADIRDIRTGMSGEINRRNLGTSNAERLVSRTLTAARRDIQRDLRDVNPTALRFYERGDDTWAQMSTDRLQLLERLTGPANNPISGEQVMQRVTAMMTNRGDAARFRRTLGALSQDERADFVATIMDRIGRESDEAPFSPARFFGQTKDWSDDALRTAFGREGAESIRNLRIASRAFRDTQGALNNSRSGFVQNMRQFTAPFLNFRSTVAGAVGFHIAGPVGGAIGAAAGIGSRLATDRLSARSLMNPDVSRWINKVARARNPAAMQGLTQDLGRIAARNPVIAQELTGLRQALLNVANDNVERRAAASDSGEEQ